jgi:RHS repeat-associated protein
MKKSRIICTFLSSHLVAVIFLVLLHIHEASACTYPPTAVILTSPSGTIFYNGNPILLDGSNSTANNGGSINQYRWRYSPTGWDDWTLIYQGTQPTRNFTFPALGSGESQKSYQIQLQVRNTSNQTHTTTITVTLKHAPDRYYYVKDHLGSVRLTLGEDGGIVSWNDYDPWGLALAGRSGVVGSADARYQFTSQERDVETGYDYFGARYYDARVGRWGSIDPLSGKYPSVSPYVYVANNTLRYFDPDGQDIWEINQMGVVVDRKIDKTQDAFYIVDANDKKIEGRSISFEPGTVTSTEGDIKPFNPFMRRGDRMTLFYVKGENNAKQLFEFFADPKSTGVEWTWANIYRKPGNSVVGTSHSNKYTRVGRYLMNKNIFIRQITHNHPSGIHRPSGWKGDIGRAESYEEYNPLIKIYLYVHLKGYIEYNSRGETFDEKPLPDEQNRDNSKKLND